MYVKTLNDKTQEDAVEEHLNAFDQLVELQHSPSMNKTMWQGA